MELELDLGEFCKKCREEWCDVQPTERRRRRHLQEATRTGVATIDEIFRFLDQIEDVDNALEVALAGLGQRQLSRRPLEEADVQPLLQKANPLRDDGRRQSHLAARGRHVAGARNACEYFQVGDGGHGGLLTGSSAREHWTFSQT